MYRGAIHGGVNSCQRHFIKRVFQFIIKFNISYSQDIPLLRTARFLSAYPSMSRISPCPHADTWQSLPSANISVDVSKWFGWGIKGCKGQWRTFHWWKERILFLSLLHHRRHWKTRIKSRAPRFVADNFAPDLLFRYQEVFSYLHISISQNKKFHSLCHMVVHIVVKSRLGGCMFDNNWYLFLLIVFLVFAGDGGLNYTEIAVMGAILLALTLTEGSNTSSNGCCCGNIWRNFREI